MSRLFFKIQLIMAPFKISNLIMFRGGKLQFAIMPSYEPTKLLDASKVISKLTPTKDIIQAVYRVLTPGL